MTKSSVKSFSKTKEMNPYCSCGKPVEGMTGKCASCNYEERKELRGLSKPMKLNARIKPFHSAEAIRDGYSIPRNQKPIE